MSIFCAAALLFEPCVARSWSGGNVPPSLDVSTPSRSLTVVKYSVRLNRLSGERPGLGSDEAHAGVTNCADPPPPDPPFEPGGPPDPSPPPLPTTPVHAPTLPALAAKPSASRGATRVRKLTMTPPQKIGGSGGGGDHKRAEIRRAH